MNYLKDDSTHTKRKLTAYRLGRKTYTTIDGMFKDDMPSTENQKISLTANS